MTDLSNENERDKGDYWRGVLLVAVAVIAVGALVVSVIALTKPTPKVHLAPVTSAAATLRNQELSLSREVVQLKAEVATLKESTAKTAGSVHTIGLCLPELTGQINGLSVETSWVEIGERTLLTNAYLKNGKQISSYCTKTLEPH